MLQEFYFYIIDINNNEIFTAKRSCKQPFRTKEWKLNVKRRNSFDILKACGARTLFSNESITLTKDNLTSDMLNNTINYNKGLLMNKESGVVFDFLGDVKKIE